MLVLSRRLDQSIVIGDSIVVTVVRIKGDAVRLGIEAPSEIRIYRDEVYADILRENRQVREGERYDGDSGPDDGA